MALTNFKQFDKIEITILKNSNACLKDTDYTIITKDSHGVINICYNYQELITILNSKDTINQIKERKG